MICLQCFIYDIQTIKTSCCLRCITGITWFFLFLLISFLHFVQFLSLHSISMDNISWFIGVLIYSFINVFINSFWCPHIYWVMVMDQNASTALPLQPDQQIPLVVLDVISILHRHQWMIYSGDATFHQSLTSSSKSSPAEKDLWFRRIQHRERGSLYTSFLSWICHTGPECTWNLAGAGSIGLIVSQFWGPYGCYKNMPNVPELDQYCGSILVKFRHIMACLQEVTLNIPTRG